MGEGGPREYQGPMPHLSTMGRRTRRQPSGVLPCVFVSSRRSEHNSEGSSSKSPPSSVCLALTTYPQLIAADGVCYSVHQVSEG
jgi:hypothetical protein